MLNIFKSNLFLFPITYIIIIIIQVLFINYYTISSKKKYYVDNILYNKNEVNNINEQKIDNFFLENIQKRAELIKNMNIKEFIEFNKENNIVKYENLTNYYFMFEKVKLLDGTFIFVNRIYPISSLENLTIKDIIDNISYNFPFDNFKPEDNIMDILYIKNDGYKYYWFDPMSNQSVFKKSFSIKIQKDNFDGFLAIGYNLKSVSNEYSSCYFNDIYKVILIFISLLIFISSIIISKFNSKKGLFLNLFLFLILPNIYILYYLNIYENFSSMDIEINRLKTISDGILSVSFLIAVNIFIISQLSKIENKRHQPIFLESVVIFSISLVFLLVSIYKKTSFNTLDEMRTVRITNQLTFNLVVYYNIFIVINYLIFISQKIKIVNNFQNNNINYLF